MIRYHFVAVVRSRKVGRKGRHVYVTVPHELHFLEGKRILVTITVLEQTS